MKLLEDEYENKLNERNSIDCHKSLDDVQYSNVFKKNKELKMQDNILVDSQFQVNESTILQDENCFEFKNDSEKDEYIRILIKEKEEFSTKLAAIELENKNLGTEKNRIKRD